MLLKISQMSHDIIFYQSTNDTSLNSWTQRTTLGGTLSEEQNDRQKLILRLSNANKEHFTLRNVGVECIEQEVFEVRDILFMEYEP